MTAHFPGLLQVWTPLLHDRSLSWLVTSMDTPNYIHDRSLSWLVTSMDTPNYMTAHFPGLLQESTALTT